MNCYIPQVDWISVCLLLQLYKFDGIIRTTTIAMQQTGKKIEAVTAYDYRSIMVPLLKSFILVCVGFSVLFYWRFPYSCLARLWSDVYGKLFPFYRNAWMDWLKKMRKRSPRLQQKHCYQNLILMIRRTPLTKDVMMQDKGRENPRKKWRERIKESQRNYRSSILVIVLFILYGCYSCPKLHMYKFTRKNGEGGGTKCVTRASNKLNINIR